MSFYQLKIAEPIDAGVRRIASELVDDALGRVETAGRDRDEAVHEVRKDCKRVRGLLRLVRDAAPDLYRNENRFFRDAAASLSGVRDAEAALESYDALLESFGDTIDPEALSPVRSALTRQKQRVAEQDAELDRRLDIFGEQMREVRERVGRWRIPADDPLDGERGFALLSPGLSRTYRRGRKGMAAAYADPGADAFHEWRKRAKYLRYHLRLLRSAWPKLLKPSYGEVKRLGDLLGDDHDLVVLDAMLHAAVGAPADRERLDVLMSLIRTRSARLRAEARWLGRRVYAEKPKAFSKRIGHYWNAGRDELRAG